MGIPADGGVGPRPPLGLGSRLLLLVVLGVVLPLGLVGLWLARGAERSGQELLRERLRQSLEEIVAVASTSWVELRSDLLDVGTAWAEAPEPGAGGAGRGTIERWRALEDRVERLELLAEDGTPRDRLEREPGTPVAAVPIDLPLHDATGREVGAVRAWVRTSALLPGDLLLPGVGGSLLGVFSAGGRTPALPLPVDADLLLAPRFRWNQEDWIAVQHPMSEPPLLLALAGPVGPFTSPFSEAARRGTLALLLAVAGSFLLVTLATRRLTGSLEALAGAADAVTRGELDRSVAEGGPDEVQRLGRAFNAMTRSLRHTLDRLSQREAVAAVGEFASALAHEVRNPLTSIRLDLQRAAERLPEGEPPRELVERALSEVRRLDATVGGSLAMARSGRLELRPLDPTDPARAAAVAAAPRFQEKGAILELPPTAASAPMVLADAAALEQVILNLLLNAADALRPGGRARVGIEAARDEVRVLVEDEGEGIPTGKLPRIFEPFYSTRPEGTGLGLPVAQRLAQAMGGRLEVAPRPGGGTAASLVLPAAPGA